jgi:hypothetical protein
LTRTLLTHPLRAALLVLAVVTATSSASAQTTETTNQPLAGRAIPLAALATEAPELAFTDTTARREELEMWIDEFSDWKNWVNTWGNRPEPGWFRGSRARRPRPDPPEWLFDTCDDPGAGTGATEEACQLLAEWSASSPAMAQLAGGPAVTPAPEDDRKTTWWEHVHLDAGWPAIQSGVSVYGVLGMHATTTIRGRFQIFVAPGAMLMNVPTMDGGRAWKVATNYGIAYRLGQFKFPGSDRQAQLHLNLAKAWLLGAGPEVPTQSTDFVGLSMTFKKTPP